MYLIYKNAAESKTESIYDIQMQKKGVYNHIVYLFTLNLPAKNKTNGTLIRVMLEAAKNDPSEQEWSFRGQNKTDWIPIKNDWLNNQFSVLSYQSK